ncbi:MAG: hypothetical protein MI799_06680 [Desulfobacterales bacterium]|nr:hypothetical protein [Desulfobacterales bacterium]
MARMRINCPDCNFDLSVNVGQSIVRDKLVWHRSINCSNCGAVYEEDGNETPEEIRSAIIKENGLWGISLVSVESKTIVYKVLRECLGLSLSDITKLSNNDSIISGTETEVSWLRNKFEDKGISAVIKRLEVKQ